MGHCIWNALRASEEKGWKKTQRVIIRQGNERAGAHTRLSYNQTDIEVYSALNTAFQSGELKMETCESSHWVKRKQAWCAPAGQRAERRPGHCHPSWGGNGKPSAGWDTHPTCRRPPNRPETSGPRRTLGHSQASDAAYFGKMLPVLDLSFPIFEVEILWGLLWGLN